MKKIISYLLVTFLLTWGLWSLVVFSIIPPTSIIGTVIISLGMFCPLIGAIVTKLILKNKETIDLKIKPKVRANIKFYLLGWAMPTIFTLLGALIYFSIFRNQFTISNGYMEQLLRPQIEAGAMTREMIPIVIISQIATALTWAPFLNMIFAFGEETGWRGLLLPALREKMSTSKAILVSGIIWGLWHAPITTIGHNYGLGYPGYPFTGIFAMCVFCTFFGAFLSYITIKSDSVWPAAFSHGALNAISGVSLYFIVDIGNVNRVLGPTIAGLVAGIPVIIGGIICMILLKCKDDIGEINNENY